MKLCDYKMICQKPFEDIVSDDLKKAGQDIDNTLKFNKGDIMEDKEKD